MIGYLRGEILSLGKDYAIIDTGNVGYKVYLKDPLGIKPGEKMQVFIHEHIKEDAHDLYGFDEENDLRLFESLISVSGVGPKMALNVLRSGTFNEIAGAISDGNQAFFSSISGIGKKVAGKIILELGSKLPSLSRDDQSEELTEALASLGYKKAELGSLLSSIPKELSTTEEKIRWCLKNLAK